MDRERSMRTEKGKEILRSISNEKLYVRICRGCRKIKRFEEWVEISPEIREEMTRGVLIEKADICPKCRPK